MQTHPKKHCHSLRPHEYWAVAKGDLKAAFLSADVSLRKGDYLEIYEQAHSTLSPSQGHRQTFLITHVAMRPDNPAIAEGYQMVSLGRVETPPKILPVPPPDAVARFMSDPDLAGGWE